MKEKLKRFCPEVQFTSCEGERAFVVDYSNETNKERGVAFNCQKTDLQGLVIVNPHPEMAITAAIFDDHCFKTEDEDRKDDTHCEAVLFPEPYSENAWNLYVELKYNKQLGGVALKAYDQVVNTVRQLRQHEVIAEDKMVYGVIYFPVAASRPPYVSSIYTPEMFRKLKREQKLILTSSGSITVFSDKKLKFV